MNLKSLSGKTKNFRAYVFSWDKEVDFEVKTENDSTWFLFYSNKEFSASSIYQKRFSIEKCFQDQKSSGFNIEKTKIRKYDRFKRLYFTMCLAQLFMVILGEYVENKKHPLKKKISYTSKRDLSIFKLGWHICRELFKTAIRIITKIFRLLV